MRHFLLSILLVGLVPALALGQTDRFTSRVEVPNGKLVRLKATSEDTTLWQMINPPSDFDYEVLPNGSKFIFSTGTPGEYLVIEASANTVEGKTTQKLSLHSIRVGNPVIPGPTPTPVPVPVPVPTPTPLPAGKYGLAEYTRNAVTSTQGIDRALCGRLASDFGIIAAQIRDNKFPDFEAVNVKLKARTQATRQGVETAWKPVTDAIAEKLNTLAKAGAFTKSTEANGKIVWDLLAVATAFEEINAGFLAAGN